MIGTGDFKIYYAIILVSYLAIANKCEMSCCRLGSSGHTYAYTLTWCDSTYGPCMG